MPASLLTKLLLLRRTHCFTLSSSCNHFAYPRRDGHWPGWVDIVKSCTIYLHFFNCFVWIKRVLLLCRTRHFFPCSGCTINSTHCTHPQRDGQAELHLIEPTFISSVVLYGSWATLSTSTISTLEMTGSGGGAESADDVSASDSCSLAMVAAAGVGTECLLDSLPRLLTGSASVTSVRENVWGNSKKRKKSCFFGFWKKNVKKTYR